MTAHDDFRRALDELIAAFDAVQLAPTPENIAAYKQAVARAEELHRPVLERAKERAMAVRP